LPLTKRVWALFGVEICLSTDRHFPNLRQLDCEAIDGIVLELGKHKGFELTELFETRESMSPFLKGFPGIVQS
jgi:hypothetical protein